MRGGWAGTIAPPDGFDGLGQERPLRGIAAVAQIGQVRPVDDVGPVADQGSLPGLGQRRVQLLARPEAGFDRLGDGDDHSSRTGLLLGGVGFLLGGPLLEPLFPGPRLLFLLAVRLGRLGARGGAGLARDLFWLPDELAPQRAVVPGGGGLGQGESGDGAEPHHLVSAALLSGLEEALVGWLGIGAVLARPRARGGDLGGRAGTVCRSLGAAGKLHTGRLPDGHGRGLCRLLKERREVPRGFIGDLLSGLRVL